MASIQRRLQLDNELRYVDLEDPQPEPPKESCCKRTARVGAKLFFGAAAIGIVGAVTGVAVGAGAAIGWQWIPRSEVPAPSPRISLGLAKFAAPPTFLYYCATHVARLADGLFDPKVSVRSFVLKAVI